MNASTGRSVSFDRPARRAAGRHESTTFQPFCNQKPRRHNGAQSTHDLLVDISIKQENITRHINNCQQKAFDLAVDAETAEGNFRNDQDWSKFFRGTCERTIFRTCDESHNPKPAPSPSIVLKAKNSSPIPLHRSTHDRCTHVKNTVMAL